MNRYFIKFYTDSTDLLLECKVDQEMLDYILTCLKSEDEHIQIEDDTSDIAYIIRRDSIICLSIES